MLTKIQNTLCCKASSPGVILPLGTLPLLPRVRLLPLTSSSLPEISCIPLPSGCSPPFLPFVSEVGVLLHLPSLISIKGKKINMFTYLTFPACYLSFNPLEICKNYKYGFRAVAWNDAKHRPISQLLHGLIQKYQGLSNTQSK